jgi:sugar lactone lactonase YvrE
MSTHENDIQVAWNTAMQTGESPIWHAEEAALYWVDIEGLAVHRLHPGSGEHQIWIMPSEPSALARHAGGGLVVATRKGFLRLNTRDGGITEMAAAPYDTKVARFNDGKVDAAGRFWVGTIYEPRDKPAAQMYCLERGTIRLVWDGGMTNSNGLAFSPDGKTMYHSDTTTHRVERFDFDGAAGTVSNASDIRRFSSDKTAHYGGRPDGGAVDSEGNYWCAMFEGGRLLKLSPAGDILQEVALPVRCPTMMVFGGADLRTLYVTTAGKRPAEEIAAHPLTGKVLSLRVDVAGLVQPAYVD